MTKKSSRSKSSGLWLKEHFDDPYVKKAQLDGYRARSVYKLLEINDRDHLLKPGGVIVDLGAAPGSWSEVASKQVGDQGRVIALDLLPMDGLAGVDFIQGDFQEATVYQQLIDTIKGQPVDLVMSDMAPNISGMKAVDQPKAMYLAELTLELAQKVLRPGGDMFIKVFNGAGLDEFKKEIIKHFQKLQVRKPKASRPRSAEIYLLARGYNL